MSDDKMELSGDADYRFLSLAMSLGSAAWAQLGKVPHPITNKIEKDIDQARMSIEFLRMLQEKTEGNLTVKEQEMLDNLVSDLEMNFADEIRKAEALADKKGPEIIVPPGVANGPGIIKP